MNERYVPWSQLGYEQPPDEWCSRVTEPERFGVLHGAARDLIDELTRRFVLVVEDGPRMPDDGAVSVVETVRLHPPEGAPITFELTDFPGVRLLAGHGYEAVFPSCGCDACDDDPVEESARLRTAVASIVRGNLIETKPGRGPGRFVFARAVWACVRGRYSEVGAIIGGDGITIDDDVEVGALPPDHPTRFHRWPAWTGALPLSTRNVSDFELNGLDVSNPLEPW